MKKKLTVLLALTIMSTSMVACGNKDSKEVKDDQEVVEVEKEEVEDVDEEALDFEEEDGKLVYLDIESAPLDAPAMKVIVDRDKKIVEFLPSDDEGNTGKDYFKFNLEENEFEKYYYVSPMGMGHFYFYDLEESSLVRMENDSNEDITESTKEADRWDGAVQDTEEEVEELQTYFEKLTGQSIEDFIA